MSKRQLENESTKQITNKELNFFIKNIDLKYVNLDSMKKLINDYGYDQFNIYLNQVLNHDSTKPANKLTILDLVANKGHLDLLKFLMEEIKVQENITMEDKSRIFYYTIKGKNLQAFQYLLEKESKGGSEDYLKVLNLSINVALEGINAEVLEFVLQKEANTNVSLNLKNQVLEAFDNMAEASKFEIIKFFLENGKYQENRCF
jgi:hypothetical protein